MSKLSIEFRVANRNRETIKTIHETTGTRLHQGAAGTCARKEKDSAGRIPKKTLLLEVRDNEDCVVAESSSK